MWREADGGQQTRRRGVSQWGFNMLCQKASRYNVRDCAVLATFGAVGAVHASTFTNGDFETPIAGGSGNLYGNGATGSAAGRQSP